MILINLFILLLYVALYLISIKKSTWSKDTVDQKEHKLYLLYPMSDYILSKTGLYRRLSKNHKVTTSIQALNASTKLEIQQKLYWCSRLSLILMIIFLTLVLSLLGQLQSLGESVLQEDYYVTRPEEGEGPKQVELKATLTRARDGREENQVGMNQYSQEMKVRVEERSYSSKEWEQIQKRALEYLEISILGNNESAEKIYENLYFCEVIPGTSITVEWQPEDTSLIGRDGTVKNDMVDTKGADTQVKAILSYQGREGIFEKRLRLLPKQYTGEELLRNTLEEETNQAIATNTEEARVKLPEEIADYEVRWTEKKDNIGIKLLLLGICAALITWFMGDQELNKKMKERKEQMLLDYPEIINKFTLLVNAGMTVRQAWNKITQDYVEQLAVNNTRKRYAYEEMLLTLREMNLGIPESMAYEQFGRRIGAIPFLKFSTLIAQNLKKGNKGISEMLAKEAVEAFEDRKETARRLGEEAGTKLLAPMMIMLMIVFVIILVPAFTSFGF